MFKSLKRVIYGNNFNSLDEIEKKFDFNFSKDDKKIEEGILDIYNGNIDLEKISKNDILIFNLGYYYHHVKKDYDLAKKYYLMSIELGNNKTMHTLGHYYKNVEKDYELAVKYYLMAVELGNSDAMNSLGYYYRNVKKDYDLAKKYYLMAIELGHSSAMFNLGHYYHHVEKDYDLMKKYYLMAIENGFNKNNIKGLNKLERYYCLNIESNDREVSLFKNRCNMASCEAECIVCLDETDCIMFECCHKACKSCYIRTRKESNKCPVCRISFNK